MVCRKGLQGFTLLEVLLAMTLLSIMVVLLFSSLQVAAESWNRGEAKIAEVNEKAVVYQFFKRHLPGVQPLWAEFLKEEQEQGFSFQGDVNRLQFVSVFPASSARKGMQLFTVSLDPQQTDMINVNLKPFYPPSDGEDWTEENVVLVEGVESFNIQFFGQQEPGEDGSWSDQWLEKTFLPTLIKITIVLADGSYWPEMVFAVKSALTHITAEELPS